MKTVFLVRHAKSCWDDPSLADFDRPLNARGKRDAPFMGNILRKRGVLPDLIVSSPAKRAKKTATKIAKVLGYPKKEIAFKKQVYDADEQDLLSIIQKTSTEYNSIMLFGHNPEFTWLANELAGTDIDNIPTAGVVCIDFEVDRWAEVTAKSGKLIFFDYPKKYKEELA